MTNCPRCGSPVQPHHKFCGTCAAPLAAAPPAPPAPQPPGPVQGYGAPPNPEYTPMAPQQYGAPAPGPAGGGAPSRCQFGHDIAPGFTYCPQGHPIALDAMQLAGGDAFGQPHAPPPQPGFAHAPPGGPAPNPFAPQPPQPAFGAPAGSPAYPPTGAMSPFPNAPQPVAPAQPPPPQPAPVSVPPTSPQPVPGGRRQLAGFLVSFHNDPLGAFFPLYAGANLVGRTGAADDLTIEIADPATSSNHATIHVEAMSGRVVLEDTGSTNGTFVNEEHLAPQSRRDLRDGDSIRFGSYVTRLMTVKRA